MGITLAHYENEVWDAASGTWGVDICWKTLGDDSTTEITVTPSAGSTPADTTLTQDHRYTMTGCLPSTSYSIDVCSTNDIGDDMGCTDGSDPVAYASKAVPVTGGTLASISSCGRRAVKLGDAVDITITAKDAAGAGLAGQTVSASVVNTPVHGTLSPASIDTDSSGNAVIAFTGTSRGTAKIDILCGSKGSKEWIWVCQRPLDYLLALLRIPF